MNRFLNHDTRSSPAAAIYLVPRAESAISAATVQALFARFFGGGGDARFVPDALVGPLGVAYSVPRISRAHFTGSGGKESAG